MKSMYTLAKCRKLVPGAHAPMPPIPMPWPQQRPSLPSSPLAQTPKALSNSMFSGWWHCSPCMRGGKLSASDVAVEGAS